MYVTADIRVALISDITFTDKGITIVKTADDIWGTLEAAQWFLWKKRQGEVAQDSLADRYRSISSSRAGDRFL